MTGELPCFIRLQSSICERKLWDYMIQEIDSNFLMCLALGYECHFWDRSSKKHKGVSRSCFQGIVLLEYVLNRYWFNTVNGVFVRGNVVDNYFNWCYHQLSNRTFTKLRYFRKFLRTSGPIKITTHSQKTYNDGNVDFYKSSLFHNYIREYQHV